LEGTQKPWFSFLASRITPQKAIRARSLGFGDINGDVRADLLEKSGWGTAASRDVDRNEQGSRPFSGGERKCTRTISMHGLTTSSTTRALTATGSSGITLRAKRAKFKLQQNQWGQAADNPLTCGFFPHSFMPSICRHETATA